MTGELTTALFIHAFLPLAGLLVYGALLGKMRRAAVEKPPVAEFFALFFNYGGWLLVFLTVTMWQISGAALLGLAYLVFLAPFVTVGCLARLRSRRAWSAYHQAAYSATLGYVPFLMLSLLGLFAWARLATSR